MARPGGFTRQLPIPEAGIGAAGPKGCTSTHRSWRYIATQRLPRTDRILSGLFDMRLPLTFSLEDCDLIAGHILDAVAGLDLRWQA
ncbi:hypothetical protein [Thermohalobaculum sediminis]|uniref:hypothetical protein n=1 Tax=Thermohalobaculum sediminis TaxID=2939436 RepID=UPI0029E7D62D|nr:hypothetical protein [Limibaculum sediminis]